MLRWEEISNKRDIKKKNNSKRQTYQEAEIAIEIKNSNREASDSQCQKWHVREEQNASCENLEDKQKSTLQSRYNHLQPNNPFRKDALFCSRNISRGYFFFTQMRKTNKQTKAKELFKQGITKSREL